MTFALDAPARIAVIGAGPIGLEAALYARFLGYSVRVFEQGHVAQNVRRWGHVRMFSPFAMNRSSLGLAAIEAQEPGYRPPPADACLTGQQWIDEYLLPLSRTDLLADCLIENVTVTDVARVGCPKGHCWNRPEQRNEYPFRVLYVDHAGVERTAEADLVVDATGVYQWPRWIGPGGAPAIGERQCRQRIVYHLPDLEGGDRQLYAGCHILLVGSGYSAATTVARLASLADQSPGTHVVWITRSSSGSDGPIVRFPQDPLAERDTLASEANRLARSHPAIEHRPDWQVEQVFWDGDRFTVELSSPIDGAINHTTPRRSRQTLQFDRIVAHVGYQPDWSLVRELHVHQCYATEGPMRLAAQLLLESGSDCLAASGSSIDALVTTEPNFYVLGAKSFGRLSHFLYQNGLQQIRNLFAIVGGRADLDLYSTVRPIKI